MLKICSDDKERKRSGRPRALQFQSSAFAYSHRGVFSFGTCSVHVVFFCGMPPLFCVLSISNVTFSGTLCSVTDRINSGLIENYFICSACLNTISCISWQTFSVVVVVASAFDFFAITIIVLLEGFSSRILAYNCQQLALQANIRYTALQTHGTQLSNAIIRKRELFICSLFADMMHNSETTAMRVRLCLCGCITTNFKHSK